MTSFILLDRFGAPQTHQNLPKNARGSLAKRPGEGGGSYHGRRPHGELAAGSAGAPRGHIARPPLDRTTRVSVARGSWLECDFFDVAVFTTWSRNVPSSLILTSLKEYILQQPSGSSRVVLEGLEDVLREGASSLLAKCPSLTAPRRRVGVLISGSGTNLQVFNPCWCENVMVSDGWERGVGKRTRMQMTF